MSQWFHTALTARNATHPMSFHCRVLNHASRYRSAGLNPKTFTSDIAQCHRLQGSDYLRYCLLLVVHNVAFRGWLATYVPLPPFQVRNSQTGVLTNYLRPQPKTLEAQLA